MLIRIDLYKLITINIANMPKQVRDSNYSAQNICDHMLKTKFFSIVSINNIEIICTKMYHFSTNYLNIIDRPTIQCKDSKKDTTKIYL